MFKKLFLISFLFFVVCCSQSIEVPSPPVQPTEVSAPIQKPVGLTGLKPVNSTFINVSGTAVKEKRVKTGHE